MAFKKTSAPAEKVALYDKLIATTPKSSVGVLPIPTLR